MVFLIAFPLLPAWLMALLPGLGGGFLNALLQQGQINRMNAFNDPRAQMQRLMRAGLPAAAFGTAGAGQQSQIPDISGIGDSISNYFQSDQQMKQGKIMLEMLRKAIADADVSEFDRDVRRDESKGALSPFVDSDYYSTSGKSFAEVGKAQEFYIANNAMKLQAVEGRIKTLQEKLAKSLGTGKDSVAYRTAVAQLDSLLLDLNFKGLNFENERLRTEARRTILQKFESGGMNLFEAIFISLLNKFGF